MKQPRRLLTLSPDREPLWVRLQVHKIDEVCAAMIVGDDKLPPEPGPRLGLAVLGPTPEMAARESE